MYGFYGNVLELIRVDFISFHVYGYLFQHNNHKNRKVHGYPEVGYPKTFQRARETPDERINGMNHLPRVNAGAIPDPGKSTDWIMKTGF